MSQHKGVIKGVERVYIWKQLLSPLIGKIHIVRLLLPELTDPISSSLKPDQVYDMASASSSSSSRAPGVRKVTFAPKATIYLFDRQVMLDRWPRDGESFGLGMQANHFLMEEHPLEDPEVHPRGRLQLMMLQDRIQLLKYYICSMTTRGVYNLRDEVEEWKKLFHSMEQSGCSCRGACDPSTCECLLAGVRERWLPLNPLIPQHYR
ncbi:hypothetical protein ACOMHN_049275 [Nucella lapillus]